MPRRGVDGRYSVPVLGCAVQDGEGMAKLTPKQERFCQEYIIDLNGAQAAIRAGYSVKDARTQASRLSTNANIQKYIAELQQKKNAAIDLKAEDTLREIARMAFAPDTDERIRPADKLKALDMLAKHQALYVQEQRTGDMVQIVINKPDRQ